MSLTNTAMAAVLAVAAAAWTVLAPRRFRRGSAGLLALVSVLSLATGYAQHRPVSEGAALGELVEILAVLVLLRWVARWTPVRTALPAGCLAVVACALWPVSILQTSSWLERAGAAAFWVLPALAAAAIGAYPRWQARRTDEAVLRARRRQQLDLARDLHDFVAHEISAIVVQAQAARFVADTDPARASPALERIERAGLNALALMDRTVRMLHDADGRAVPAAPGLADLPALVERFGSAGATPCHLGLDPAAVALLTPQAQAAGYRTVVEGLTNVRRHAAGAKAATVAVRRGAADTVEVVVSNDVPPAAGRPRAARGGHGLAGLRDHVAAAGGTLTAGAHHDGGWRLSAVFPHAPTTRAPDLPAPGVSAPGREER